MLSNNSAWSDEHYNSQYMQKLANIEWLEYAIIDIVLLRIS